MTVPGPTARRARGVVFRAPLAPGHGEPAFGLPGPLAGSRVWPARDAGSRSFALIENRRQWTAALSLTPTTGAFPSDEERAVRMRHWHRWLADLGREPGLVQAAVVLDQSPDPGRALQVTVEAALDREAPPLALAVLREAARQLPSGAARLAAHVSVTYGGPAVNGSRPGPEQAALEIGTRLPMLSRGLASTAAGEGRPLTPEQLVARVRGWFDPAIAATQAQAQACGEPLSPTWADAGPVATQERPDSYRHDSGLSRTYELIQPPPAAARASALLSLIAPLTGVARKRVTLLYRPVDGGAPGVAVAVSLLVTVTAEGVQALNSACEAVVLAGRQAQIWLRPVLGAQPAAFASGLGVGVVPTWGRS